MNRKEKQLAEYRTQWLALAAWGTLEKGELN